MPSGLVVPWALRAVWAGLPFLMGPSLAAALDDHSRPIQVVASLLLWSGWAVVLLATLAPHPIGLTALRVAAPAGLAVAGAAAVDGHGSALAVAGGAVAVALAFLHETGVLFVNGPAYPNERRLPLRVPGALLLGVVPLAWALSLGAPTAGILLLAARQWIPGAVALAAGLPLAALLLRSLHALSRRWVVFVPAGVVLHDPLSLTDPVLLRRQSIERLGPARAGSDSTDLSQRAPGLALELLLKEEVPIVLTKPGDRSGRSTAARGLIFTPIRPGAVLREAAARRVATG